MPIAPEYLHLVFPDETFYALLYGRNSVDPKKKGRSVEAQLADGRDICDRFSWPVVEEFKDTGISASRHARKQRDDFEDLLAAIEGGRGRIVVAYEASRYYRDLEAYVRLRNACFKAGVLLCYNGTVYDLSKKEDRKATAMDAIAAEEEADDIQKRNLRTAHGMAAKGHPHGRIPYGFRRKYDPDTGDLIGQYEHPVHGAYVLMAFRHIDAGGSLNSLVKKLKETPEAARPDRGAWSDHMVKYMLQNRAYLGERMHHGSGRDAEWEPLKGLDGAEGRALFRRVQKILTDPSRGERRDTRAAHLLTNLAYCGVCGDHARLKWSKRHSDGAGQYVCEDKLNTLVREQLLDAYVEEAVIDWFGMKDKARAALIPDQRKAREAMAQDEQLLDVYTEELEKARELNRTRNAQGRPLLSLESLSQKELELLPKIEELRARLETRTGLPTLVRQMLAAEDPDEVWNGCPGTETRAARPALTLEQRRQVLRHVVTVRLYSASRRGVRTLEPGRVALSFMGEAGFRARPLRAPETARAEEPARGGPAGGRG